MCKRKKDVLCFYVKSEARITPEKPTAERGSAMGRKMECFRKALNCLWLIGHGHVVRIVVVNRSVAVRFQDFAAIGVDDNAVAAA